MGSAWHANGTCKPCAHNWKAGGCYKGKECPFCHLCSEETYRRVRKKKEKVSRELRLRREMLRARHGAARGSAAPGDRGGVPNPPVLFDTELLRVRDTFIHFSSDAAEELRRSASSPAVLQSGQSPRRGPLDALELKHIELKRLSADSFDSFWIMDPDSDDAFPRSSSGGVDTGQGRSSDACARSSDDV